MATFLNESVLSLPEQVEKNKNDIKEIEETIGGIEPDLVNQVHTNTSDISAIKQEQTLQNTAINNNTNKTQNINANGTQYGSVEKVANASGVMEITADGLTLESTDALDIITPNTNISVSNSGVVKISNDNNSNKLEYDGANGSFKVSGGHTLEFDSATGDLTIDGGAVGGGDLYEHRISFIWGNSSISINIITTYSEQVTMSNYKQKLKGNFLYSDNIGWYSSGDGIITIARISIQDIINQYHLNGVSSSTSFTPQLVTDDVQPYV